jgi:hypothetical protein
MGHGCQQEEPVTAPSSTPLHEHRRMGGGGILLTIVETDRKIQGIETLGTVGTMEWIAKEAGLM